jgi:hypothetical protein
MEKSAAWYQPGNKRKGRPENDNGTFIIINVEGSLENAKAFGKQHGFVHCLHLLAQPPAEYCLQYIPHHVVIGIDGIVKMNYTKPSKDYLIHAGLKEPHTIKGRPK